MRLSRQHPPAETDPVRTAMARHPEATALLTELAARGIVVELDGAGRPSVRETKGVAATRDQLRRLEVHRAGVAAICVAIAERRGQGTREG